MATTSSGRLVKTSLQFTPEQHDWLTEESKATGESISVLVRQAVREMIERRLRANGEAA